MHLIPCSANTLVLQLRRSPVFAQACDDELMLLSRSVTLQEYGRMETIYEEDSDANAFYVILSGRVKVIHRLSDGRERLIHVMGAQDSTGLPCMFRQKTYPCTALAQEPCRLLRVERESFQDLVSTNQEMAMDVLGMLSIRLRMFARKLGSQGSRIGARLAGFILHRATFNGVVRTIDLGMSREELANMIGTARETLSRNLSRLVSLRLIAVSGRTVSILDREGLESYAAGENEAISPSSEE